MWPVLAWVGSSGRMSRTWVWVDVMVSLLGSRQVRGMAGRGWRPGQLGSKKCSEAPLSAIAVLLGGGRVGWSREFIL